MAESNKRYLNTITLLQLETWSVRSLLESRVSYNQNFELARIADFLIKSRDVVEVEDTIEYRRVTVKIRNGGVILRDKVKGSDIGTKKQYRVKANQFIISKIDARNGAFGIIPKELNGAIVTNDFPVFTVDKDKINAEFLLLITTTKEFIKFAQSCSSGTTNRQRMDIDLFLNQRIPLPSLKDQEQIVNDYKSKREHAHSLLNNAKKLEEEIKNYFTSQLGIQNSYHITISSSTGLRFTSFRNLTKWGIDFIDLNTSTERKYPEVTIKEICKISSGGTPSRGRKEYYNGGTIPWIKTGELNDEIIYDSEEKITQDALMNSSAKLYNTGSLLIAMYGATIGKTGKLGVNAATNQACAVLYDFADNIVVDYLWEFLQTQTEQLKRLAYGSAQPNLNAGIIANYSIPLPPLSKQNEIVNKVAERKAQIRQLNEQANRSLDEAVLEFETKIFS